MTWIRGPTIGRGSSAVVSLATTSAGDRFAVKSAEISLSTFLRREENLISRLCSPYVVRCFGSDETRETNARFYNLFLEYVPGGTLSDQIKKRGGSLEESAIRSHARRILLGLDYLHGQGLAHCDIKGENILVGDGGLKIADLGCAKIVGSGEPADFSGTPAYMAPEVARGEEQSFPADVWALGCTIVEMATGSAPWTEMREPAAALYRIGFSEDVPEFPGWLSGAAKEMLARCLTRDPRERWTAGQLLRHSFFDSAEEDTVNCGGDVVGEFTPTSVMDQGFWDVLESSDCSGNPTEVASTSDSPGGWVDDLVGRAYPANNCFPSWEDGDNWLTVRGYENEIEESIDAFISMEVEDEDEIDRLVSMEFLDGYSDSGSSALGVAHTNDFSLIENNVEFENYVDGIISSSSSTLFCFCFGLFLLNTICCVKIREDDTCRFDSSAS